MTHSDKHTVPAPIYDQILSELSTNGTVTREFLLDVPGGGEESLVISPGALDSFIRERTEEERKEDIDGIRIIMDNLISGNTNGADITAHLYFAREDVRISLAEEGIDEWLEHNADAEYDRFAVPFIRKNIRTASDIEFLKFILLLCSHLRNTPEDILEDCTILACYGEFTYFALNTVEKAPDGGDRIFRVALRGNGHGKSEAVSRMTADTPEKKSWLLANGTDPFLGYWYSAGPISIKCDVYHMLDDPDLSDDDYNNICTMVGHYFCESMAEDLYRYPYWKETMLKVMDMAQVRRTPESLEAVRLIKRYESEMFMQDQSEKDEILSKAETILASPEYPQWVRELNEKGEALALACELNIDDPEMFADNAITLVDEQPYLALYNCRFIRETSAMRRALEVIFPKIDWRREDNPYMYHDVIQYLEDLPELGHDILLSGIRQEETRKYCFIAVARILQEKVPVEKELLAEYDRLLEDPVYQNILDVISEKETKGLRMDPSFILFMARHQKKDDGEVPVIC